MACLIALLSSGKGSWSRVLRLIKAESWNKVFLIAGRFGKEKFKAESLGNYIEVLEAEEQNIVSLRNKIYSILKTKIDGFEVAVNLDSGTGKEHMALLSAILKLGLGIRIVGLSNNKIIEL